ncbi:MAG: HEAT repeat domain-containing protein [Planctomycetota bacterium]
MKNLLHAIALLSSLLAGPAPAPPAAADVAEIVAELKLRLDDADPDLVRELANLKTSAALDGLLEVYEVMNSVYMRRAVLRGIALYDGVPGEEQRALQRLMDAATESSAREIREIAVDEIAGCPNFGKAFLAMIVESAADDEVRERAMAHHTSRPRPQDGAWYMGIYDPATKAKDRPRRGGAGEGEAAAAAPPPLPVLRELAFDVLASDLDLAAILAAAKDENQTIRRRAIQELDSRNDPQAIDLAEKLYSDPDLPAADRLFAVAIVLRGRGVKVADDLINEATRPGTAEGYALGLADLLADLGDPAVDKALLKAFGTGRGLEQLFFIRAGRRLQDPKIDKTLLKLVKEKDPRVLRLAMEVIAERRLKEAGPELEKLAEKTKDADLLGDIFDALGALREGDPAWEARLVALAGHENPDVRNGAIAALGKTKKKEHLPVLVAALENPLWSTRLAAAQALDRLRAKEGVGALCARIAQENGRLAVEMGQILFRMTGQPFGNQGRLWERWWRDEGAAFEFIDEAKLRRLEREEETRRLKQVTTSSFFGIKIESTRVIFILDVSGSMDERTRGKYEGQTGTPRIDVARRELARCLDSLETQSLFNMIVFSDGVDAWSDSIRERNAETLADAKAFVARLHAGGSTNLFGSLELAFRDPEVDTIFVLSDGEPTSGRVVDPAAIRAEVAEWNEHRGVVIHCIAVGGSLSVLEWLAADSGGTYVKFP